VKGSRWLGISVGTLTSALALWLALLAIPTSRPIGLLIAGVGLAFAMYSVAGFSGAQDPMSTGFNAALTALITAATLTVLFQSTSIRPFIVVAPVVAISLGGTKALAPTGDKQRNATRLAVSSVVIAGLYFVFIVEPTAYGLMAPLLPLPALGIADRIFERGKEIVDEQVD